MEEKVITIVHILDGLSFGGIENNCLRLLNGAPKNFHNVLINLDPSNTDMFKQFKDIPDLEILNFPYKREDRIGFIIRLMLRLRKIKPKIILSHCFGVHVFVAMAGRLAGVSRIRSLLGNPPPQDHNARRKCRIILFISRLLGVRIYSGSKYIDAEWSRLAKLPVGSRPIWHSCDVNAIAERACASRQKRDVVLGKVIGMVARLNKIKDHETLIKAFGKIYERFPDVRLWLIGDGEEKDRLSALVERLGLSKLVIFWGNRSDIPEMLGSMDIFVFSTTRDEGFGIALLEAMAASLPIIASDVPACREVLGSAGILVPEANVEELARQLGALLTLPDQRMRLGRELYQRVERLYKIEDAAKAYYSID